MKKYLQLDDMCYENPYDSYRVIEGFIAVNGHMKRANDQMTMTIWTHAKK